MQLEFARPVAPFTLDPLADAVIDATGRIIPLTRSEFRILHLLMRHADRTLAYQDMIHILWGYDDVAARRNFMIVYIFRLRRKIEPDTRYPRHIITVRGQGYSFRTRRDA
jgi:two-component system, OmpR family, response regulator RegX3